MKKTTFKKFAIKIAIVSGIMAAGLIMLSLTAAPPDNLGVDRDGKLQPCPNSPNCVASMTDSIDHQMDPIRFTGDKNAAIKRLKDVIAAEFSNAKLIEEKSLGGDLYLRYEFCSTVFRFVDDVEFILQSDSSMIQFRSASRVGHSDLGVNRNRIQRIAIQFDSANP